MGQELAFGLFDPHAFQQAAGNRQDPVDVERCRHVRLHLRVGIGDRHAHGVAGKVAVEPHVVGAGRKPHVHAGRADDRAAGVGAGIVEPGAECRADHVDIAKYHRCARGKADGSRRILREQMMRCRAVNDLRQEMLELLQAEKADDVVVVATGAEIAEGEVGFGRVGRAHLRQLEV
ncbi:hypothetical protein D3C72_1764560 [compost metagenome]